jgi:hypothetical protein
MSLSNLIRGKSESARFATATPATFATLDRQRRRTVAGVATVAVAKPPPGQAAPAEKVGAGETVITSRKWLLHYLDRDPLEMVCCPEATHAEILGRHPDAVAAEPFAPTCRRPSAPMTANEESAIRNWLALIEETDPVITADVVGQCQRDVDARSYFIERAEEELPKAIPDDRRTCSQCSHLRQRACAIAKPERGSLVVANRGYRPDPARLLRCAGYVPLVSDSDQRTGAERWPGIVESDGSR